MKPIVIAAILVALRSPAVAGSMIGPSMSSPPPTAPQAQLHGDQMSQAERERAKRQAELHDKLLALRDEGLKLREADGGTLTTEHRAYLQAKLDALNAQAPQ
jgi:hypothetical protein